MARFVPINTYKPLKPRKMKNKIDSSNFPPLATLERAGIKIEIRSPRVLYIRIADYIYYIDDSTGEQLMDYWHESEQE